jgi:hypothetical protein
MGQERQATYVEKMRGKKKEATKENKEKPIRERGYGEGRETISSGKN